MDKQSLRTAAFYAAKWRGETFVITVNIDTLSDEQLIDIVSSVSTLAKLQIKVMVVFDCDIDIDSAAHKLRKLFHVYAVNVKYLPHTIRGKRKQEQSQTFHTHQYWSSDTRQILSCLESGYVVTLGPTGLVAGQHNSSACINPLAIAFAVARKLQVAKLIVLSKDGSLRTKKGDAVTSMSLAKARQCLKEDKLDEKSTALLGYMIKALRGAKRVTTCRPEDLMDEVLTSNGAGTLLFPEDSYEFSIQARRNLGDVYEFLKVGMQQRQLKERSFKEVVGLRKHLRAKMLDDEVVGVVGLKPYDGCGEVVCLRVEDRFNGNAMGPELVVEMLNLASRRNYVYVFAVTYDVSAKKVFESQGFCLATLDEIPATKKQELEARKDTVDPWIFIKYI